MIKLFRKIRQALLSDGKTGAYLTYAIGEIILVVFGILIALQVNNWNEKRQAKANEISLFENAVLDLKQENSATDTQIRWFKNFQDVHFDIYEQTKDSSQFDPDLDYNTLIWTNYFRPLIQENYSSKVGDMSNEIIKELFRDLIWRENLTLEAMNEWNNLKLNIVRPFFARYGINNSETSFNHKPYEFMSLDDIPLLDTDKLKSRYGTRELDQILYESRHNASWVIHCLTNMKTANEKLQMALSLYIDGEIENLDSIEPIDSYY